MPPVRAAGRPAGTVYGRRAGARLRVRHPRGDAALSVGLKARLSLPEAVGLSLAVIAPTVTAAFNISLVARAAGPAAPLCFLIGMVAMTLLALSFVAFTRRVAHAGAAYAYVTHTFGTRAGFIAGWTLVLAYVGFATGFAGLIGSFTATLLGRFGIDIGRGWILAGVAAMVLAWWLAYRDMKLAGRLMLVLEVAAVVGILWLCVRIVGAVHPSLEQSLATLRPAPGFGGWTGVGAGLVYTVLSYSGFEGAATLGEETVNPRRNIPLAMFGTVLGAGVFFMFVAYCEVIGYGDHIRDLGTADAPISSLAARFGSPGLAIALDIATITSAFSGILGGLSAAGRVLFALGRAGLSPGLAQISVTHGTPARAVAMIALLIIVPFVCYGPFSGGGNYYSYLSEVGALALSLIYIAVGTAELVEALREGRQVAAFVCAFGPLVLAWALYRTVYPPPAFPDNLWPYVTLAWAAAAIPLIWLRPAVSRAPLPEYR